MQSIRIILSIVFVLYASTALAVKPEKTLVCHVGSELGSSGETYLENPDCIIPSDWVGDPADYNCPDAGKVDLISVSKNAKHFGNDAHSFLDAEGYLWEDYLPEDGVGDEPADFDEGVAVGIDRGCELLEENLACPCWDAFTEDEVVAEFNAAIDFDPSCWVGAETSYALSSVSLSDPHYLEAGIEGLDGPFFCSMFLPAGRNFLYLTEQEGEGCHLEANAIILRIAWCTD